jgi:hypothetical protein
MSLAEYDGLLIGWNRLHEKEGDMPEAPDLDFVRSEMERLQGSAAYTH